MDENGKNWFLYLSVFSVNMMSFTANIGFSWTSPFLPKLNGNVDPEKNPLSNPITLLEETWITTFISIGSLCGPLFTGKISEKIGKKTILVIFSIPILLSNVVLIFANTVLHFYVSRFLLGLGIGCVYCVVPAYVAEITDVSNRGKTGVILSLMNSINHVCVVSIGPYVTIRTFAYVSLIPCLLFLIIFIAFIPESPYYYVSNNRTAEAEQSLKKFRQRVDVKVELAEITNSVEQTKVKTSFKEVIKSKVVVKGLVTTVGLMLCQQITGSQPMNAYQQEIFHSTDSAVPSEISVIIVGVAQFLTTLLVVGLIDKVGRKNLLLISFSGVLLSLISLGAYFFLKEQGYNVDDIYWFPIVSTCLFMMCFRGGVGPVPWSIVGEIFPSNLKVHLSAVVTFAMVVFGFIVTFVFPIMFVYFGMACTFWIFAICTIGSILFIWLVVPEIKGKSFLEIQLMLKK